MIKQLSHYLVRTVRIVPTLSLLGVAVSLSVGVWLLIDRESVQYFLTQTRANITLSDDALTIFNLSAKEKTVGGALAALAVKIDTHDHVTPALDTPLDSDMTITITRAQRILVRADGDEKEIYTREKNIGAALADAGIVLGASDIVSIPIDQRPRDGLRAKITRVYSTQESTTEEIAFKKIIQKDSTKDIGDKEVTQEGVVGEKEIIYTVTLHDGKEEDRHIASEKVTTPPVDEITVVGTREVPQVVKVGKSHTGQASWYGHKGCACAANPWLPFDSHVKVTNKANGKSVVVRINDRGPFVPGRIIDLDKTAFTKIASLGAGVIDVKMEEIKE